MECMPVFHPFYFCYYYLMKKFINSRISFYFPNKITSKSTKKSIINGIAKSIPDDSKIGFAGYLSRKKMERRLTSFIFGSSHKLNLLPFNEPEIKKIIINSITRSEKHVRLPGLHIFIFPTQNPHTIKHMRGVNGFTPYKNTIHIFLNTQEKNWKKQLSSTIAHEIAHVISFERFEWDTILDGLIFEGLAEHFREWILGGKKMPWTFAISKRKALSILKKLEKEDLLYSKDNNLYDNLFFGGKKYIEWSGYTLGYEIIKTILKSKSYSVNDLLKLHPSKIFLIYKKTTQP